MLKNRFQHTQQLYKSLNKLNIPYIVYMVGDPESVSAARLAAYLDNPAGTILVTNIQSFSG